MSLSHGKGVSPELIREIGEDGVDVRACLERGLTLSAKEMRCHSELRWDRRLEPLNSASVSLRGCCAGKSPIVIIEDDVIYTISFPSSLFLSVLPEKIGIVMSNGGLLQTRSWQKRGKQNE